MMVPRVCDFGTMRLNVAVPAIRRIRYRPNDVGGTDPPTARYRRATGRYRPHGPMAPPSEALVPPSDVSVPRLHRHGTALTCGDSMGPMAPKGGRRDRREEIPCQTDARWSGGRSRGRRTRTRSRPRRTRASATREGAQGDGGARTRAREGGRDERERDAAGLIPQGRAREGRVSPAARPRVPRRKCYLSKDYAMGVLIGRKHGQKDLEEYGRSVRGRGRRNL